MRGFSVFEILLVVTLLIIVLVIYFPSIKSIRSSSDLITARSSFIDSLKRSQVRAISAENDSVWGTKIEPGKITIFKGDNFTTRDRAFDEIILISSRVNWSGLDEIYFSKLTGRTNSPGTITFDVAGVPPATININEQGVLDN